MSSEYGRKRGRNKRPPGDIHVQEVETLMPAFPGHVGPMKQDHSHPAPISIAIRNRTMRNRTRMSGGSNGFRGLERGRPAEVRAASVRHRACSALVIGSPL